jgi:hypothetical protein
MTPIAAFQIFVAVATIFGGIMLVVTSEGSFRFRERRRAKLRNRSLSLCLGLGDIEVEKMRVVDTGRDKYRVILDVRKAKVKVPSSSTESAGGDSPIPRSRRRHTSSASTVRQARPRLPGHTE